MAFDRHQLAASVPWNMFVMLSGCLVFTVGFKGAAVHYDFLPSGLYGMAVFANYLSDMLPVSGWYLLMNVPIFAFAWKGVSRRFFLLNLFCMGMFTVMADTISLDFGIQERMHAAIASGALMGAGCGMIYRTFGAGGGLDVVAVILNQKYNLRIGVFYFGVNGVLMLTAALYMPADIVVASLVMSFIASVVTEYVLSMFSQRKSVIVISGKSAEIAAQIREEKKLMATVMKAEGMYSGQPVDMIYSITDNIRLKALESLVFEIDPQAIFVVENTFSVIGPNFNPRKVY